MDAELARYRAALEKIAEERQTLYRDQAATQPVQALTNAALIAVTALGWGWDFDRCVLIKNGPKHAPVAED